MKFKVSVTMWVDSWKKFLACINSKTTHIDKMGDWRFVYKRDLAGKAYIKDEKGQKIKELDPDTQKPLTLIMDYDPNVSYDNVAKFIQDTVNKAVKEQFS